MLRGSIPPTGIPMPFISAGGTSLMVFMAVIGILCNVGKSNQEITNGFNLFKRDKLKGA